MEVAVNLPAWHKSSYSSQDGNCVEVARDLTGVVAVRDSKDPHGGVLAVSREQWAKFIESVRSGQPA